MLQCWNEIPERRPTFPELCGRLQRMLEDCQVILFVTKTDKGKQERLRELTVRRDRFGCTG